jgi:hypothetical protein
MIYYFINYSRRELCSFDAAQSILMALEGALNKNRGWNTIDDIQIKAAESSTIWKHYVNDLGFRDLEMVTVVEEDSDKQREDDMFLDSFACPP